MSDDNKTPILSAEDYLKANMVNELESALAEFKRMWNSSAALQTLLKRGFESEKPLDFFNDILSNLAGTKPERSMNSNVVQELIQKGALSPEKVASRVNESFGGLSRGEILKLLEKHKAGKRSLGTYLLLAAWKHQTTQSDDYGSTDMRLRAITLDCFERAVSANRADFFHDLAETLAFLSREEFSDNGKWSHDPSQWWQFHLLLYIFNNPRPKYAMREFRKHFAEEVGENEMPTVKTLRKFCHDNDIQLDSSPGAPKKTKAG